MTVEGVKKAKERYRKHWVGISIWRAILWIAYLESSSWVDKVMLVIVNGTVD